MLAYIPAPWIRHGYDCPMVKHPNCCGKLRQERRPKGLRFCVQQPGEVVYFATRRMGNAARDAVKGSTERRNAWEVGSCQQKLEVLDGFNWF